MAILPIVRMGHPVLRSPAAALPPAALAEAATQRLIDDMIETMHDADGVGLAAPQVGVGWQLFVYQVTGSEDADDSIPLTVVVNPMIDPIAGELAFDWEGCLSIPDLRGLVPRHPAIRMRGLGRDGEPFDRVVEGFEARVAQHEFDHLNGVLFLDRMRDLASLAFLDEWHEYFAEPPLDSPTSKTPDAADREALAEAPE